MSNPAYGTTASLSFGRGSPVKIGKSYWHRVRLGIVSCNPSRSVLATLTESVSAGKRDFLDFELALL
jgi:hypothetical protein